MTPMPRAREIFVELVNNVPQARWEERLAEAAGSDIALLHRVRALLSAHADPGSFLQQPAVDGITPTDDIACDLELSGAVIDRYTLKELIGEGGFGVVYLAEQREPLQEASCSETHQAWDGHEAGNLSLRGRTTSLGAHGSSEHCQGSRRRHDSERPSLSS